ncbi:transposase [Kitasatospora cathayae]|uniref:Mutator family transposase n=1 Tax=Kitasatospora cathayae TaxID=3004092 RepID=A0ABY7PWH1_9ACTN|nr:transposase [Kitasatospora sp. HUAS 3-15]WBP84680.1 transposase [Kitasatospora sp. HUAS 3-15]
MLGAGLEAYRPLASKLVNEAGGPMSPAEAIVKLVLRGQDPDGRLRELVTDALSRADGDLARGLTLADLATAWRPLVMTSDKLASAFALERRSPFLARDPVEFAYRLAVEHKIADPAAGKRILRDAAKALGLPREVWGSRDKLGFASPVPSWLSGPLEPWARAQISSALDQAPRGLQPLLAGGLRPGGRAVRPHPDAGPDGGGLVLPPHAGRCGMTDSRLITVSAWTPRLSPPSRPPPNRAEWSRSSPTCVIHLIRASLRLSSGRDHSALVPALRAIYGAPTEQAAERALDELAASELGERYPAVVRTWRAAWGEFTPYLAFPAAIRKVVYSTNMVESMNSRLRKATRNRGHFPSEQAALKVLYLAVREQISPRARDINHVAAHWKEALNQFSLFFEDRLSIR